eukprot:10162218-Heterocapsa_arctica.AAC.1
MVNNDTHISGHSPVRLNVGKLSEDMGSRIKRPVDFQGTTGKEAKSENPTEGTFTMKGNNLNQQMESLERVL